MCVSIQTRGFASCAWDDKTAAGDPFVPVHPKIAGLIDQPVRDADRDGYLIYSNARNKYGERSQPIGKRFGRLKTDLGSAGIADAFLPWYCDSAPDHACGDSRTDCGPCDDQVALHPLPVVPDFGGLRVHRLGGQCGLAIGIDQAFDPPLNVNAIDPLNWFATRLVELPDR
jgi:hypothetical protein